MIPSKKSLKTVSTTCTSSTNSKYKGNKWRTARKNNANLHTNTVTFKSANQDLKGNVFIKGLLKIAKYDKAYNAILIHIGMDYDNRVYKAFEHNAMAKVSNLLTKPKPPESPKSSKLPRSGQAVYWFVKKLVSPTKIARSMKNTKSS